jgi:hypothetical protein
LLQQAAAAQAHEYQAKERIYTPSRSFTGPDSDAAVFFMAVFANAKYRWWQQATFVRTDREHGTHRFLQPCC